MTDSTPTQTRTASERYVDMLGRLDDNLQQEFDAVVSDLLHERDGRGAGRLAANEAGVADLNVRVDECEQVLAAHIARCPGATDEERARWRSRVEEKAGDPSSSGGPRAELR